MRPRIVFLLIPLFLLSCASGRMIELGSQASRAGMEVCNDALDVYSTLSEQREKDKFYQDRVEILLNRDPANMTLPDTEAVDYSEQILLRKKAYKSLLNTYRVFNLLTDKEYGNKNEEALAALQNSYNSIAGLPELPGEVSTRLPEVAGYLSETFQAKKIKKHNKALYALSEAYLELWKKDSEIWIDYLDQVYDGYARRLNQVSSDKYNPEAIARNLDLPYSDDAVLLMMYRLELRKDIRDEKNEIIKEIEDVEKALTELTIVHSEISKDKPGITDIISTLDKIEAIVEKNN